MLFRSIRDAIDEVEELVVVADGALWYMPFECLPLGAGGQCVGDAFAITYAPSAAFLCGLPAPRRREGRCDVALFGDPRYPARTFWSRDSNGGESGLALAPLPGTQREIATIC